MTTTGVTAVIAAVTTIAAVVSAAFVTYKREQFERDRITRLDDERRERNKKWIDKMDNVSIRPLPSLAPRCEYDYGYGYGMVERRPVNRDEYGRIDVNWVDDFSNNPYTQYNRQMYGYPRDNYYSSSGYGNGGYSPAPRRCEYGYGYGYSSPSQNTYNGYNGYNNTYNPPSSHSSFGDDEILKMIGSRPPSLSPIFGMGYRAA